MKVKYKLLNSYASIPERANPNDAGFDLKATEITYPSSSGVFIEVKTGIALEIPKNYVGLLFPRSSISNTKHFLRNSVGVIDSGYRGEIKLRFSIDDTSTCYQVGDKVGQIIFVKLPSIELVESQNLDPSHRGEGGLVAVASNFINYCSNKFFLYILISVLLFYNSNMELWRSIVIIFMYIHRKIQLQSWLQLSLL